MFRSKQLLSSVSTVDTTYGFGNKFDIKIYLHMYFILFNMYYMFYCTVTVLNISKLKK